MLRQVVIGIVIHLILVASSFQAMPDLFCLKDQCLSEIQKCYQDQTCSKMLTCLGLCFGREKCSIGCTMKYGHGNEKVKNFLLCLRDNKCLRVPADKNCKLPVNTLEKFDLSLLNGNWWVIRGLSSVYDCWQCQKMYFAPSDKEEYWDYKYDMLIDSDVLRTIDCTVKHASKSEKTGRLVTEYLVQHVFSGTDDWHVLDIENDYMLIYYCGKSEASSTYQGAIVIGRDPIKDLPHEIKGRFEEKLKQSGTGVSLEQFCKNDNTKCPQTQ